MNTEVFDLGKIGITLGGEYDNKVIYEKLTIVLYKGKSYISTKTVQGLSPEQDIRSWQLVAEAKDVYHMLVDADKTTLTEEEFLEQLVDATKGRYIIQGNVINAADEEDLTVEHSSLLGIDTLKLADRPSTGGMGYVILRKNKSFAEQVTKGNTIYEIRYEFDLSGTEVTIPIGCIFKFVGGSIKNGHISFNNTIIDSYSNTYLFKDVEISGTIANNIRKFAWFEYSKPHDDWNTFACLVSNKGTLYLDSKTYNLDKNIHSYTSIKLSSDLTIIGCSGCTIYANHTSGSSMDGLFEIHQKENIVISNLTIQCVVGTQVVPPAGHGSNKYDSSGIYVFLVNDYCSNINLNRLNIINAGIGLKTTRYTAYTGLQYFENIEINNCVINGDMVVQGKGFANLKIKNSTLASRGTNSGNHVLYILPITTEEYTKDNSIYIDNCALTSVTKDGLVVQVYTENDDHSEPLSNTYFTNCRFDAYTKGMITCSSSARAFLSNCELISHNGSNINTIGRIEANNCRFTNVMFYKNVKVTNSILTANTLCFGDKSAIVPVEFENCSITCNYVSYNNSDNAVPQLRNCNIVITGDGLISQRASQKAEFKFENCCITIPNRLVFSPGKAERSTLSLIRCTIINANPSYFYNDADNTDFNFVDCIYNGDLLNIPLEPKNSGISSKRPSPAAVGQMFFDTILLKPIYWTGTKWVDATGADI